MNEKKCTDDNNNDNSDNGDEKVSTEPHCAN